MRDILGIFDAMDRLGRLFHDPEGRRRRAARRKARRAAKRRSPDHETFWDVMRDPMNQKKRPR